MWKQILFNINAMILTNWAKLLWFVVGMLAGATLFSCSMFTTIEAEGCDTPGPVVEDESVE
tara:strand:+ start:3113 stop:3295 length:183 start_codon:yes stop_codon:yes gene_type:complete